MTVSILLCIVQLELVLVVTQKDTRVYPQLHTSSLNLRRLTDYAARGVSDGATESVTYQTGVAGQVTDSHGEWALWHW